MKERHWTSLVTSLRHGQCVLMLGPEVSAAPAETDGAAIVSRNHESFAETLMQRLADELEEDGRRVIGDSIAAVAQQYEDASGFGTNALRALAEKFYNSGALAPSALHRGLASLPFGLIVTTSHDDLMLRALKDEGKSPLAYRYHLRGDRRDNPEFVLSGSASTPIVYHLFGTAREPGSLVLSENDLLDFLIAIVSERPPLPNSLSRALKRSGQSFLFVGFGISQWYLRVLMKVLVRSLELHRTASTIAAESLRGLTESDRERTILFYQRGTRIEVEDADVSEFLSELAQRLAAEGGVVAEPPPLGPRPRVFISYAREDGALASRLFEGLDRSRFEPWLDQDALIGGENWDQRIRDELAAADYTLVLYTPALCRKTDSYVNREIALARNRALGVRGSFLIPLRTADIDAEERVAELSEYQEMPLRPAFFDQDLSKVVSTMLRDFQRRNR
jgi:TIR domain-containing protein/SIR2-like protein